MRLLLQSHFIPSSLILTAIIAGVFFFYYPSLEIWGHRIWLATLIIGGAPIVYRTVRGMLQGQFASDIIAMLAIITALLLSEAFAGAVVVLMQSGGEAIEQYGFRKASSSLTNLLKRAPQKARRKGKDLVEEIEVTLVQIGDILIVRPGELVPVDGIITQGITQVDESALTGEPLEREKTVGNKLLSGSVNISGAIEMRAEKKSEESQYSRIVKLVQKAQEEKAPIQRLADHYAILFTPLTLCIALIGYIFTHDFLIVLSVLVVATPCPLILATPLAVMCGVNRAAKEGIIIKGGAAIEQIASADAILFDKTGTITFGAPIIEKITPLQGETEEEILNYAATLEQLSTHSIAQAIVKRASKKLSSPQNFKEIPGRGVLGEIDGHKYAVGSATLFNTPTPQGALNLVYIFKDEQCIGTILFKDHIRPNAAETIERLAKLNITNIMMITGDRKANAEIIAKEAGITQFAAELLPEQKVDIVKEWGKTHKHLIMVGDGINDAPALATATIGIAMGAHGTAISAEAANIVLLIDDLSKVVTAIQIGRRMLKIAKQSIFTGIGLSVCLMFIALTGTISPPLGALLQEIIDITVILNALRVLKNDFMI